VRQIRKDPIEGALESLATMQKLGKQVYLVTNNSTNAMNDIFKNARRVSLNLSSVSSDIIVDCFTS
jgi:ribonucleotide monophosphatase NagD (HAD superfamily)